MKNLECL